MSAFSPGPNSMVKSKQNITVTVAAAASTGNVAITAVDLTKSFIILNGEFIQAAANAAVDFQCGLDFTSSTNVRISRIGTAGNVSMMAAVWEMY
jgi:hypothetical protein